MSWKDVAGIACPCIVIIFIIFFVSQCTMSEQNQSTKQVEAYASSTNALIARGCEEVQANYSNVRCIRWRDQ